MTYEANEHFFVLRGKRRAVAFLPPRLNRQTGCFIEIHSASGGVRRGDIGSDSVLLKSQDQNKG